MVRTKVFVGVGELRVLVGEVRKAGNAKPKMMRLGNMVCVLSVVDEVSS